VTTTPRSSSRRPPIAPPWQAPHSRTEACANWSPTSPTTAIGGLKLGRERLRQILREHHISFQRTRTWKESTDPDKDAKLAGSTT
jgi:hypothetical protein